MDTARSITLGNWNSANLKTRNFEELYFEKADILTLLQMDTCESSQDFWLFNMDESKINTQSIING